MRRSPSLLRRSAPVLTLVAVAACSPLFDMHDATLDPGDAATAGDAGGAADAGDAGETAADVKVGDACASAANACDAGCGDTRTDRSNCGICGNACVLSASCVEGRCLDTKNPVAIGCTRTIDGTLSCPPDDPLLLPLECPQAAARLAHRTDSVSIGRTKTPPFPIDIEVRAAGDGAFGLAQRWDKDQGGYTKDDPFFVGDFDGDGLADLGSVWRDDNQNAIVVRRSTGSAFALGVRWAAQVGAWQPSTRWLPSDFDGDGRVDLAAVWNAGGKTSAATFRSTGSAFEAPREVDLGSLTWVPNAVWQVGDFDGDRNGDFARITRGASGALIDVYRATPTGFEHTTYQSDAAGAADCVWRAGDFDGDHRTDLAVTWNDGGAATVTVLTSTGNGFAPPRVWLSRQGGFSADDRITAADVDGDGLTDLVTAWYDAGQTSMAVRRSNGTSFDVEAWGTHVGTWDDQTRWCAGAFRP